jgi:hypothetical protein
MVASLRALREKQWHEQAVGCPGDSIIGGSLQFLIALLPGFITGTQNIVLFSEERNSVRKIPKQIVALCQPLFPSRNVWTVGVSATPLEVGGLIARPRHSVVSHIIRDFTLPQRCRSSVPSSGRYSNCASPEYDAVVLPLQPVSSLERKCRNPCRRLLVTEQRNIIQCKSSLTEAVTR